MQIDWNLLGDGTLDDTQALATAIIVALGTDGLADSGDELPDPDSTDRRGWWGDYQAQELWDGWPIGSRLWLLKRAKIEGPESRNGATTTLVTQYIREAIQPFIDRRIGSSFTVEATRVGKEQIDALVRIYRGPIIEIELRYAILWQEMLVAGRLPTPKPYIAPVGKASGRGVAQATSALIRVAAGVASGTSASFSVGGGRIVAQGAASGVGVASATYGAASVASGKGAATGVGAALAGVTGAGVTATITEVQYISPNNLSGSVTSKSATGAAVASGDCVVGVVSWQAANTAGLTSITDDKGNSYTIVDSIADSTHSQTLVTFIKWNITNAPSTITANFSSAFQYADVAWTEYFGTLTTDPRDGHNAAQTAATTAIDSATSGNFTTTANNDLIWSASVDAQGNAGDTYPGTNFTMIGRMLAGYGRVEQRLQTTAATTAGTWSIFTASTMLVGAMALKPRTVAPGLYLSVGAASGAGAAIATPPPSGTQLKVQNGKIVYQNGVQWRGLGIAVVDYQDNQYAPPGGWNDVSMQGASLWTKVKNYFPGTNLVRLACYWYNTPANYAPFINAATADGCYVVIEHHPGSGVVLTGPDLTTEQNWYASCATYFLNNPLVMYQSINEPGVNDDPQMIATYNTLRNAGYQGIIFFEAGAGANGSPNDIAGSTATFNTMRNTAWDVHAYNWMSGYSNNEATIISDANSRIAAMQTIHSADGIMPCVCLETGNSTNGSTIDAAWQQQIHATYTNTNFQGVTAWLWDGQQTGGEVDNLVTDPAGTALTPNYGVYVQTFLSTSPSPPRGSASGAGAAIGRPSGGISRVQGGGANGGTTATTIAVTLSASVASGSFVCGAVSYNRNHTLSSVTDDKGNSYNLETPIDDTTNGQKTCGYSRGNITNAPTIITATFADATQARSMVADEFSGVLLTVDPRDSAHGGQALPNSTGTGANAVTSGNFTTTAAGDLLYGAEANVSVGDDGSTTVTAGTTSNATYTLGASSGSSGNSCAQIRSEWAVQSVASAVTAATFTHSAATGRTVILISAQHA